MKNRDKDKVKRNKKIYIFIVRLDYYNVLYGRIYFDICERNHRITILRLDLREENFLISRFEYNG